MEIFNSTNADKNTFKCIARGFPTNYTYCVWEHRSFFGEHIRYLVSKTEELILPYAQESYQDSGYYTCFKWNPRSERSFVSRRLLVIQTNSYVHNIVPSVHKTRIYVISSDWFLYKEFGKSIKSVIAMVNVDNLHALNNYRSKHFAARPE